MVSQWYRPRPQFLMVRPYLGLFCHRAAIPTPASGPWLGHHISHWKKNTGIFYLLSVCNSQPLHQDLDMVTVSAFHICVCSLLSVSLCFVLPACSVFRPQIHIDRMARLASDVDLRNHAVSHNPCVLWMVVPCRSRRPLSTGLCTLESNRRRRHGQFDILRPSLHCRSRAVQTFNVAGQSRNTQRLKGPETGACLEECVAQHEHTQSSTAKHKTPTCCESGIYRECPGSFKKLNAVRGMWTSVM